MRHLLLGFASILLTSPLAMASDVDIYYPTSDAASFVITAPEEWELDPADEEGGYFDLSGPTGATFSFRTIDGQESSLLEAIEESIDYLANEYNEVELSDPKDWTPDGLEGFYATGQGVDKESGEEVVFGLGWCAMPDGSIAEMWFVTESTDKKGTSAAERIADSLRAP